MSNGNFVDYYRVFGLQYGAKDDAIKQKYRELQKKYHPDMAPEGKKDEYKRISQNLNEAFRVLGFGGRDPELRKKYDKEYLINRENELKKQKTRDEMFYEEVRKAEIKIPENDIGLLAALIEAYKSKSESEWNVKKSENDKRGWMPENVYSVVRDGGGNVSVFRTIKDWRLKHQREEEVEFYNRDRPWELEARRKDPNIKLGEKYFSNEGMRLVRGVAFPYGFSEYLRAMKSLANKLSKETGPDGYRVDLEVDIINRYTEGSLNYFRMEGFPSSAPDSDKEIGRRVSFDNFWGEVGRASKRVERINVAGKEGQQYPRSFGGENKG